ncbi:unnamed protein product [Schistosoma turkestanicum]|nr:unnamed protein product [Schistosoma turkestanicum]
MSRSSSEERVKSQKCPYEVYRSVGDAFLMKRMYQKAIMAYDQALERKLNDRHCLLRRSSCYLALGNLSNALIDTDVALLEDPKYYKSLYLKGQILYNKGDFEHALVYFHLGQQQRPELQMFRLGIQKCEEAVRNSLTSNNKIRISSEGARGFAKQMDDKAKSRQISQKPKKLTSEPSVGDGDRHAPISSVPKNVSKMMFGPLHVDHEYLEDLLKQESEQKLNTLYAEEVRNLARNGIFYLDERSKFWHQQNPVYARAKHIKYRPRCQLSAKENHPEVEAVLNELNHIDKLQREDQHESAVKHAEDLLEEVKTWDSSQILNFDEIVANIFSMLGLSNLELGNYDESLEYHQAAYELGQENNLTEVVSYSMDNMGRAYAKKGDYKSAVKIWEEKLKKSTDELDTIWLYYELGRSYLELHQPNKSFDYGEKALRLACTMKDKLWQMNIHILIGQSNFLLKKRVEAQASFNTAYELAKELEAHDAEKAILGVINELESTYREMDTYTQAEKDSNRPEDALISPGRKKAHSTGELAS